MSAATTAVDGTDDPMGRLRRAGADGHRRVDRLVLHRLRGLTPDAYGDLLEDLARVHLALDRDLRSEAPVAPRPVAAPLAADLRALGRALPRPGPPSRLVTSTASAFGVLYVVEGSAAGGPTVAALVRRRLGPDAPVGFLTRAGGDPTWWPRFAETVRAALASEEERRAAGAAAQATFARFADALDRSRAPAD